MWGGGCGWGAGGPQAGLRRGVRDLGGARPNRKVTGDHGDAARPLRGEEGGADGWGRSVSGGAGERAAGVDACGLSGWLAGPAGSGCGERGTWHGRAARALTLGPGGRGLRGQAWLGRARWERGLARAALVGAGCWQAKRGLASWAGRVEAVGPRKRKEVGWAGLRVWVLFPFLFFSNTLKLN